MKKFLSLIVWVFLFLCVVSPVHAIENPLSVPNNKFGIHILFPSELGEAANLVNTNGGDWGYVTIPIQSGDRDLVKWQSFMDEAKKYHLIPLVRLATEGDYFNTQVWRKPTASDVLDFANFLDSLTWPTKNRYVIVFNEVNRNDEWGGQADPAEYADILSYAVTVFKSKNQDFFILPSGMDNVAATVPGKAINQYSFFQQMNDSVPGIFNQIDGLTSHSYPNPGFAQPPQQVGRTTTGSFLFEGILMEGLSNKQLPVFITETGWSRAVISDEQAANYYNEVLQSTWNDEKIVAITPFILRAGTPPFDIFSFINSDGSYSRTYNIWKDFPKTKGNPHMLSTVLGEKVQPSPAKRPYTQFNDYTHALTFSLPQQVKTMFKWLLKM